MIGETYIRGPLVRTVGIILVGFVLALLSVFRPEGASASTRPNFVLIQLDDFANLHLDGTWVDSTGQVRPNMPLTSEAMLANGVRFTRYLAPNPICAPSRASLLSGQYADNNGVLAVGGPNGGWDAFRNNEILDQNLAVWLRNGGYRTMQFGKFMNFYMEPDGYPTQYVPPGWDIWQADGNDESTREYYGYSLNLNGSIGGPFGAANYGPGTVKDPPGCPELGVPACNYHTDAVAARAFQAITATPSDTPFFAHIGIHTPHGDSRPPIGPEPAARHYDIAEGTPRPTPVGYDEANVSDKPPWIESLPRINTRQSSSIREEYVKSVEALQSVDQAVANLIGTLAVTGRLSNTYVFLFSDNGFFHGEHRLVRGKRYPYEPAVRVPMLVRGPGIPKGARSAELVANQDIAPTVLSLAGLGSRRSFDGRSMAPFWTDPARTTRRPVMLSAFGDLSQGTADPLEDEFYRGIRLGPYKYVLHRTGDRELYDLTRDPDELRNLVKDRRYYKVKAYMARQLEEYRDCAGQSCRAWAPKWPRPTS
ncbi:MAG: sulfatase [Solirubrobacterales bacterium]|nr:sulfatase [Solirubrobacterales bacterium]